ncbi:AMP-binding protein [Nocardia sp. IBHARD005]|uniref:AMP-binding protein n=1 Tax=Nocardia sp. IBHARD005 TaxID=3457765 RepID=UPI00405803BD
MTTDLPLTAAQHGIATAQRLWPHDSLFTLAESLTLTGPVDAHRWARAVRCMVADTEAQRIMLHDNGTSVVQRIEAPELVPVTVTDLTGAIDPAAEAESIMRADRQARCDPYTGVTTAHRVLILAPGRVIWYHRAHHVALDGYGFAQCARRVAEHYHGQDAVTAPSRGLAAAAPSRGLAAAAPSRGLADVVAEDLAYTDSPAHAEAGAYWQQTVPSRSAPVLTATPAPPAPGSLRTRRALTRWAPPTGRRYGVAESVLAAVAIYLSRRTGDRDVVLGVPMMNRIGSVAASVPAMVLNAVALPVRVDPGETVAELAARIGATLGRSRRHARYRHERLRTDLGLLGGGRTLLGPVVNIMAFDYDLDLPGVEVRAENRGAGPVEDLSVNLYLRTGTAEVAIDANPRCYSPGELAQHADALVRVIEAAAAAPDCRAADLAVSYLPLHAPDPTPAPHPLAEWQQHVAADHTAPALIDVAGTLSRAELSACVAARAATLTSNGVRSGDIVAMFPVGSATDIVTVLAAQLAGAAHTALDPTLPVDDLRELLQSLSPAAVVHIAAAADAVAAAAPEAASIVIPEHIEQGTTHHVTSPPAIGAMAAGAGYAVLTSGSTGRPKAVRVGGAALAAFTADAVTRYRWDTADRVLQFAPLHADTSIEEIFVTLAAGACLVLAGDRRTPAELTGLAARYAVTVLDLPTAIWHELAIAVDAGVLSLPPSVRQVVIGGEEASPELVARWRRNGGPVLHNTYGPSEAAVVCVSTDLTESDPDNVPLGTLFPHAGAVLAVDRLEPADPAGPAGILHLYGPMLAEGYLPETGAGSGFGQVPVGAHMVRAFDTGDRVRLAASGMLEFGGRVDGMIKIAGARIGARAVEDLLRQQPGVGDALVTRHGDYAIGALITVIESHPPTWFDDLRAVLADQLPSAWVPARITAVDALPRTRNLKADRRGLPVVAPGGADATTVLAIFAEVLGRDDLGPGDDFFAAGGTSMQILALANRLTVATDCPVAVDDILTAPTPAGLATRLAAGTADPEPVPDLPAELTALRTALTAPHRVRGHGVAERCAPDRAEQPDEHTPTPRISSAPAARIMLTGATGFLGAYLLTDLLTHTAADILTVVRADSAAHARARLRTGCAAIGAGDVFDTAWDLGRLTVLLGDCARDDLTGHRELLPGLTQIVHNAAQISAVRSYTTLREVNVVAAHRLVRLAQAHGAAMTLVSTATAAGPRGRLADPATLPTGYAQSKCVAEHLLATATREFGVPTTVVRLGRVLPAPQDSRGAGTDFLHDLLAAVTAVGMRPATQVTEPMTRADEVARAVATILGTPLPVTPRIVDLLGPAPVSVGEVLARSAPGSCQVVSPERWRSLVADCGELSPPQRAAVLRWCDIELAGFDRDWQSEHAVAVPGVSAAEAARLLGLSGVTGAVVRPPTTRERT